MMSSVKKALLPKGQDTGRNGGAAVTKLHDLTSRPVCLGEVRREAGPLWARA